MKKIMDYKVFLIVIFFIVYGCAGMPLKDFEPGSEDEQEIIELVMKHERAWNERDISGFMATYHGRALIEIGCSGPLVSKSELSDEIEEILREYPTVKFINPRLEVSENNAVVTLTSLSLGNQSHIFELEMLKESDRWLITKETCI